MIYLFVTKRGSHTFNDYLNDWTGNLKSMFKVCLYEDFMRWPTLGNGTYIFTDLERLADGQLAFIRDYADQLLNEFPGARVLNHPQLALRRRELLNTLHHKGINSFRAFTVTAMPADIRYPVFFRMKREHQGPASPLLQDANSCLAEALRAAVTGVRMDEILAVEYCETRSPDGWYRKYSAFRFGDRIIPAHIIFSKHWIAKDGALESDVQLAEEAVYMRDNPHEQRLRQVFDLANIQYGRIDYSMLDGHPQIWEINTNPVLLKSRAEYEKTAPKEIPVKESLASILADCFTALNVEPSPLHASTERNIALQRFADMILPHASKV